MKLSIIICVYNERETILAVLEQVQAVDFGRDVETEVVVVDNYSTDGTRDFLKTVTAPNVKIILQPRNMGKGMSVRTGVEFITGEYAVIQDADLEYHPAELRKVLKYALDHNADAVFGSRILGGHVKIKFKYLHTYLGVRVLTMITNLLFGGT